MLTPTLRNQAVGPELELGTRLIPTKFFNTTSGRTALAALVRATLPFASPYIGVTTPFLYDATPGATSVTPAWRDAIWHLSVKWQFNFNDTLAEREYGYAQLEEHVQQFRDLTPGSGAYFVSDGVVGTRKRAGTDGDGVCSRTRATCTSPTTSSRTGATTTPSFLR